jgi:hypothetical protein
LPADINAVGPALLAFTHPRAAFVRALAPITHFDAAKLIWRPWLLLLLAPLALLLCLNLNGRVDTAQAEPNSQSSQEVTAG